MKILFISNKKFIGNVDFGGGQCAKRNYELIVSLWGKENVKYIIFSDEIDCIEKSNRGIVLPIEKNNIAKYMNLLLCRDCFSGKIEKKIKNYIIEENPDIVVFDGSSFGLLGRHIRNKTVKIVFYHNIEKHYAWTRIWNTSFLCIVKYISFWINERYITKKADICICLNKRDDELLYKYYRRKSELLIPISFRDIGEKNINTKTKQTNILLFVGSYFMPNIKGIRWFCKNVMPYVNKTLLIVGKGMESLKGELETEQVNVVGTVDDINEYYRKADALVMPIFVGDGMKVKTAEAMMYGKPMFATNEALEGYKINGSRGIYVCNTAEEFVDKINNQDVYGFSSEIRKLFLHNYCTDAIEKTFREIVQKKLKG